MKKIMIFVGIAIALCTVLALVEVGLRNDENDLKSFEKPKNFANIQANEDLIESKEHVYKVDYTEFWTEDANFIIVYGYDKDGKAVWKYETEKTLPTENMTTEYLKDYEEKVYVNDNGTIKALDYQTGKAIWECPNVSCANTSSFVDYDTKTLYLYSPVTNMFYAIDKNGKILKEINMYESNGNSFEGLPTQMDGIDMMDMVENNGLIGVGIRYIVSEKNEYGEYEETRRWLIINLHDYSIHYEKVDSIND